MSSFQFSVFSFQKKVGCFCLILIFGIIFLATSFAEEITFEVTVDKAKVSLNDSIQLNLAFYGTQAVPTPYFPGVDGFNWRYLGPSTMTSIINGQVSSSITHRYILIPLREGLFKIPSFSIQFRGQTYTSEPITVEVVRGPLSPPQVTPKPTVEDETYDLKERVFLVIQAGKRQAYLNEKIPLTVKLYVNNLALRDIQYPQVAAEGFSLDEFTQPKQYQETLRGVLHQVIEFETNVFATHSGELKLGPAELKCNLLIKEKPSRRLRSSFFDDFFDDDFFARYRTYPITLSSIDIPMTILPLPEEGKPTDFSGAIGSYTFSLSAEPKEVKVGDPLTLKMTISGEGNLTTVNPPKLDLEEDFKVYEPDVQQDKNSKTFEQVIIPKHDKINQIPQVSLSFFNPQSREYKRLTQGPVPIKVKPLAKDEKLQVFEVTKEAEGLLRKKEILGQDIIYIKDALGKLTRKGIFLCKNKVFIALQFLPLLAVFVVLIFQRRKERLSTDIGYARRLRASPRARKNLLKVKRLLQTQKTNEFFDVVFRTLKEYLGDKFHLPTPGITASVIEELRYRNIDQDILDKIGQCFQACDIARYAPASITKEEISKSFKLLEEIIDRLERMKG